MSPKAGPTRRFQLRVPAEDRHLAEIRDFIQEVGEKIQIPTKILANTKLAVDEACTNVVKHGYKGRNGFLEVVVTVLEDEGYGVLAAATPSDGVTLLQHATFDVVITDGFSPVPSAVLTNAAEVLQAAGTTPVALFSAHPIDLAAAQAAGFRALIQKPCDIDELLAVIKDSGLPLGAQ